MRRAKFLQYYGSAAAAAFPVSYYFNGTNQYFDAGTDYSTNSIMKSTPNVFSIGFVFKRDSTIQPGTIFASKLFKQISIEVNGEGKLLVKLYATDSIYSLWTGNAAFANQLSWHQVFISVNLGLTGAAKLVLSIDGSAYAMTKTDGGGGAIADTMHNGAFAYVIGASYLTAGTSSNYFKGFLSDFCIWDSYSITPTIAAELYNGGCMADLLLDGTAYVGAINIVSYHPKGVYSTFDSYTSLWTWSTSGTEDWLSVNMDLSSYVIDDPCL